MFSSTLRSTILPLSLLVAFGATAARGVLKADGIIRVKGADLHSGTVTVVPGNATSYGLPIGSKHITLDLPLDDVYLISVQRAGCPTKEIYFDTRVPVEMHARDFSFPFMVTLEHLSPDRMFTYEGPVGFVRYVHALEDFGYETQYIVRVEEELKQRMKIIQETGSDPKLMSPITQVRVVDRPRGEYSAAPQLSIEDGVESNVAPMVAEVPRLVHVVSDPGTEPILPSPVEIEVEPVMPDRTSATSPTIPSTTVLHLEPRAAVAPPTGRVMPAPASVPNKAAVAAPASKPSVQVTSMSAEGSVSRSEELITETRRVTRIVRFTQPTGAVLEYRKVTHAFGGVYYFLDGTSITERAFQEATGADLIVAK